MEKCKRFHYFTDRLKRSLMINRSFPITSGAFLLFISFLIVLPACKQHAPEEVILAQIKDLDITETHFKNSFKEYYYRTGQVLTPSEATKLSILNSEFNTYVLATYAQDLGLDKKNESFYKMGEIERRVITEEYLNQYILKDIEVTETELLDYFIRFNSTLRASHLFAHDYESAEVLHKRLQNGESFESLAKEVFKTPYLANNGGDLGEFTTDEMDIAFENAAFTLKVGEISEPVKTVQGYSIIKLTDRFTKPILTEYEFASNKNQISPYVYKKKKELATRQHMYTFIDHLEIEEKLFDELWEYVNPNYQSAISKSAEFLSALSAFGDIASYDDFKYSGREFSAELKFTSVSLINGINDKESFRDFLIGTAYRAYMMDNAKQLGIDKQDEVKESIDETFIHYLADEATVYMQSTISNSEEELRNAFFENRDRFYAPLNINLARVVLKTENEAKEVLDKVLSGVNFSSLVKEYSTKNEEIFTDGELGFEPISSYGFLSTKLADLEINEVSEIIQYQSGEYHIYKCLGRIEAKELTFSEARPKVDQFLKQKKLKSLRSSTIEQVKKEHDAIIDIQRLKELTIQI